MAPTARQARRGIARLGGYTPGTDGPRPSAGQDAAGVILALFIYPVLMNLLVGGPSQAMGWVAAKFWNAPYAPAGPPSGNNTFGPGGQNSGAPAPGSPITTTVYRSPATPSMSRSVPA